MVPLLVLYKNFDYHEAKLGSYFKNINRMEESTFIDSIDQQNYEDAKLARMNPEAFNGKMEALKNCNPLRDLISVLKNLLGKKSR